MIPPPWSIAYGVERWVPGYWRAFVGAVNNSLGGLDVTITSWYRTPDGNAAAGGLPDSQHLIGGAIDVGGRDFKLAAARLDRAGFIVVEYERHCHAQAWPAGIARDSGLFGWLGL